MVVLMSERLFDRDPIFGLTRYFQYNDDDDTFTIRTEQDVEPLLDENKAFMADAADGWRGELHRVASIPMPLYMQLKMQGIVDDERAFKRWLNDRDNRFFRTRPGIV